MATSNVVPVILCGGNGTRLWPLSRQSFPKQFVKLLGDSSLFELTVDRVRAFSSVIHCVASEAHRFFVSDALDEMGLEGQVILEPAGRNTAPAMALAVLQALEGGEADPLLLFCPADHHIPDVKRFSEAVLAGVECAEAGYLVTFGIVPTSPSTAYGYIQKGVDLIGAASVVDRFVEKPSRDEAERLLTSGQYLWNAGIFLVKASVLAEAMQQRAPDIWNACAKAMAGASVDSKISHVEFIRPDASEFSDCRSESIDYAVLESYDKVAVVPFAGQWSDVGSWNAAAELAPADENGNRVEGHGVAIDASNTYINAMHHSVVALGTRDLIIVDTPDATLVADKNHAESVKLVVSKLVEMGLDQAVTHRRVARPWGWYDSIDAGPRFQVKRIGVKPGASLSLQQHHHRAEHWIIVRGTASVTVNDEVKLLTENQSTYVPLGAVHRLHNPGKVELEMIEVQSGSYLGEDDIVRFEDNYGRAH